MWESVLCHLMRLGAILGIMYSGNVWESNPLGALFKPPDGFEDHGQHQLCKHSRNPFYLTFNIVDHPVKSGFIKVYHLVPVF